MKTPDIRATTNRIYNWGTGSSMRTLVQSQHSCKSGVVIHLCNPVLGSRDRQIAGLTAILTAIPACTHTHQNIKCLMELKGRAWKYEKEQVTKQVTEIKLNKSNSENKRIF